VKNYSLTHVSDESLRRELSAAAANEKHATAELVAHIAEFDERKLYLPAAYPNMFAYCVGELRLSEDAAKKRIQVARVARLCPAVFEALAEGRVHLSGLVLLAPHLNPESAIELLIAAQYKSKAEIERLLAERTPKLPVPAAVTPVSMTDSRAPGHVEMTASSAGQRSPGHLDSHARVEALSAEAYAVQFTRSREADERFRYAQDLLGHQVAPNDIAEVYDLAMKELVKKLERTRCAATSRPGRSRAAEAHLPDGSDNDVLLALQTLGYRAGASRRAMALCSDMPGASADEKLRRALTYFPQRCHRVERFAEASGVSTDAPPVPR